MRRLLVALGVLTIACGSDSAAQATNITYRGAGLLLSGGAGLGSAGVSCDRCGGIRESGPSLTARLGGTLNQYLGFAGQIDYLRTSGSEVTSTTRDVTFAVIVYPSARSGFYLSGNVGQGQRTDVAATPIGAPTFEPFKASAIAIGGGLGYEFGVSSSVALSPYFTAMTNITKPAGGDIKPNIVQVGIALTWHGR